MGLGLAVKQAWERVAGVSRIQAQEEDDAARRTIIAPMGINSIFSPFRMAGVQNALPKPTAANLRRFAETPVVRRAINSI